MILTITPNPAVDRTAWVDELRFDTVLRPRQLIVLAGGKGVNVARAATTLGAEACTTGLVGGMSGRWFVEQLQAEGLNPRFVELTAETRTTYTTVDRLARSVLVYEDGPEVGAEQVEDLLELIDGQLARSDCSAAVVAGSMPGGAGGPIAAQVARRCLEQQVLCIVDTTGEALRQAAEARVAIVKVNAEEAAAAGFGGAMVAQQDWPDQGLELARALVAAGAGAAVVTGGAQGAVAADGERAWVVQPASVDVVSTVGSGDAFAAGLAVATEQGRALPDGLATAAAAGAANAAARGAGRFSLAHQRSLAAAVTVTEVAR